MKQHQYRIVGLLSFAAALLIALAIVLPTMAQEEPPCYELPECYEVTLPGPTQGLFTPAASGTPSTPWTGYSDGRLNPAMDEYYSLWCVDTFLEIWRGVPSPALLQLVPIWLLEDIPPNGGTETIPNYGMTPFILTRNGDTITISGEFGNLHPLPGTKSFSLSDCISRDGHTAAQRGSGQGQGQGQALFGYFTVSRCYPRDSVHVQRGVVPADQICDEDPDRNLVTGPGLLPP